MHSDTSEGVLMVKPATPEAKAARATRMMDFIAEAGSEQQMSEIGRAHV